MDDGGLGRAIDHRRRKAGQPAGDAAIVDDAAGALFAHVGRGVLHAEHDAAHQSGHRRIEAVDLEAFDATGLRRPAGVVEQAIDPAEFIDRECDQRTHLVFHRDVGLAENAGGAESFRQRLALGHAAPGDHDFCAFGHENLRCAQPDAARRPGNDRDLAIQPSHIVSPRQKSAFPLLLRHYSCTSGTRQAGRGGRAAGVCR